jgi:hypothetical protein
MVCDALVEGASWGCDLRPVNASQTPILAVLEVLEERKSEVGAEAVAEKGEAMEMGGGGGVDGWCK